MIKKLSFIFLLLNIFILLLPSQVNAISTGLGNIPTNRVGFVNQLLRIAIGAAGGVAFLLIIYGGFKLAFSRGDPQAVQDARDTITSAIVGLILVVLSVFLLRLIGIDILGLPI